MTDEPTRRAIDAVWRIESPRLIAGLTRMVRDIGTAEELAQDALVAAMEQWPDAGVPRNPGAWLMLTAKRRAIDLLRRNETYARKLQIVGHELETEQRIQDTVPGGVDPARAIEDDLLRMVFTACHPALSREARVAITLRLLGGLTTDEIARAFLVPESTVAQRIVRAKRTIATKQIPYEVPHGAELAERLTSVLEVVYLIFNEGYAATSGADWMRLDLCEDALRLGRVIAGLMPDEPEVHGLVALLELQASRSRARTGSANTPIMLLDQDRSRWDQLLIHRGLAALARSGALSRARGVAAGPYALQAGIAATHAMARTPEKTDWIRIAGLYAVLANRAPSPVVELNRAVAVAMAYGPAAGLELADTLAASGALNGYHLLPSVRGHLLAELGRNAEARTELEQAAALTGNGAERALLLERATAVDPNS
ncbi:RNA polymerase sigma factor [Nocardia uniformis]|uniref:RNA polymerase sigma factor n=1 Tax=Nocardia uniformis TaxID=53432 RepID=UPI000836F3B5|nr:RNA polymerase sigma factor [Nocardia uniformis]